MTQSTRLIIRDALATDVPRCLTLDHSYETSHVWQVSVQEGDDSRTIQLREQRLPRDMLVEQRPNPKRLNSVIAPNQCFLVAVTPDNQTLYGYLVMTQHPTHHIATVRDVVVDAPFRRHGIGSRLLRVAKKWTQQYSHITQIHAETQTKNVPAIQLYQRNGYNFCGFNDRYFDNQDIAIFFCQPIP